MTLTSTGFFSITSFIKLKILSEALFMIISLSLSKKDLLKSISLNASILFKISASSKLIIFLENFDLNILFIVSSIKPEFSP